MPSQIKPTRWIYALHNLQEVKFICFPIFNFGFKTLISSLLPLGKIFQILALKEVTVSDPYLTELKLLLLRVSTLRKL